MDPLQILSMLRGFSPEAILTMPLRQILEIEHISDMIPNQVKGVLSTFPEDATLSDVPAPALLSVFTSVVHKYATDQGDESMKTVSEEPVDDGHFVRCKQCKRTHYYAPKHLRVINAAGDTAVACRSCGRSHIYSNAIEHQL